MTERRKSVSQIEALTTGVKFIQNTTPGYEQGMELAGALEEYMMTEPGQQEGLLAATNRIIDMLGEKFGLEHGEQVAAAAFVVAAQNIGRAVLEGSIVDRDSIPPYIEFDLNLK